MLVCEHPDKSLYAYLLSGVNTILLPFKKTSSKTSKKTALLNIKMNEYGNNISEKLQVVDGMLGEELRMLHHPKRKEVLHDSKSERSKDQRWIFAVHIRVRTDGRE